MGQCIAMATLFSFECKLDKDFEDVETLHMILIEEPGVDSLHCKQEQTGAWLQRGTI